MKVEKGDSIGFPFLIMDIRNEVRLIMKFAQ